MTDRNDAFERQEAAGVRHPGKAAALVLFVLVLLGFFLARSTIFVLRSVQVVGGEGRFTPQQIADIAGIRVNQSIFSIDRERIRKNVESNRYLRYEGVEIRYPDSMVLYVQERQASATVTYLGIMFVLDDEGRVLEQYGSASRAVDVPVVTGLKVKNLTIGEKLTTETTWQMDAVRTVLAALSASDMTSDTAELNVSDPDNLYLMTQDGLKIELGDVSQMELKVSIAQSVLRKVKDETFLEQVRVQQEQAEQEAAQKRARDVANGTMTQEAANAQAEEEARQPKVSFKLAGAKLDVSTAKAADFVPAQ